MNNIKYEILKSLFVIMTNIWKAAIEIQWTCLLIAKAYNLP